MKFDDILREVGEFGAYQKRLYLLLCIPAISVGCFMMMNIILLYTPNHRCKLPDYPNDTWEIQDPWHQELVNRHIPPSADYDYDRCHLYTSMSVVYDNDSRPLNATTVECKEWVFDTGVFKETYTSKHDFVCGDALKTSHAQLVFYFGVLVGDLGFGLLSDVLIPESPRWLLTMNRVQEAEEVMKTLAKVNKVELPPKAFSTDTMEKKKGGRLWQLFTSRILFIRTMIIFFNWVIVSMCYYGVTMYSGTIGGNFYLNFFLLAVVEFPAFINIWMLDCMGRKWTHVVFMWLGGFACIGTIFTVIYGGDAWHPVTLALALVGKLGPTGAFAVIYVFSLELYPTQLRNAGMGASSCTARFGGMAAPYVAKMGEIIGGNFGKALPLAIFGITSVLAGLMCLYLPETLNQKLPDTVEEAKHFKGHQKDKANVKVIVIPEGKNDA